MSKFHAELIEAGFDVVKLREVARKWLPILERFAAVTPNSYDDVLVRFLRWVLEQTDAA